MVGHTGVFSGPQSINQNESYMYNEVIMIEKSETNFKRANFFYIFVTKIEISQTNAK